MARLSLGVHGGDVAHLAKPRRAHQAGDHGRLLGQQVSEGVQGLLPGQVQGDGPDGAGGEGGLASSRSFRRAMAQISWTLGSRLSWRTYPALPAGGPGDQSDGL